MLILSLYCVSLPMAFFLSVVFEIGVTGLWTGFACGQLVTAALYAFMLFHVSWKDLFAQNRSLKPDPEMMSSSFVTQTAKSNLDKQEIAPVIVEELKDPDVF